jgi:hypothetical protein
MVYLPVIIFPSIPDRIAISYGVVIPINGAIFKKGQGRARSPLSVRLAPPASKDDVQKSL